MLHLNPYVHTVTPRAVRLLLFVLLLLFVGIAVTTPAGAQTETPVVEPTLAVTLEPTSVPELPVPADDAAYIATIEKLTQLIDSLLTEGGGAAALAQMPIWVVLGVCIGFAVGFVVSRLTPTKADDAVFDRLFSTFLNFLGAVGLRVVAVHPTRPPAEGGEVVTTTEIKSQTVQTPPDDEHTVGGQRPPGFENWTPRG